MKQFQHVLTDLRKEHGTPVTLPNQSTINDNVVGLLPLPDEISTAGRKTHVLSGLKSANLISLGQLADDGCKIHLDDKTLLVDKKGKTILTGVRNAEDGLYDIPIYKSTLQRDNFIMPNLHALYQPTSSQHLPPPRTVSLPLSRPSISTRRNPFHISSISPTTLQSTINLYITKRTKKMNT